jgi:hypothetical protein
MAAVEAPDYAKYIHCSITGIQQPHYALLKVEFPFCPKCFRLNVHICPGSWKAEGRQIALPHHCCVFPMEQPDANHYALPNVTDFTHTDYNELQIIH